MKEDHRWCPVCYSQLAHDERDKIWSLWNRIKAYVRPKQWEMLIKPPPKEEQFEMQLED